MALLKKNRETHSSGTAAASARGDQPVAERPAGDTRGATATQPVSRETKVAARREAAYERFGGINWGAAFFGWLVAVGVAAILTGITGAVLAGIGSDQNITRADAEASAGTYGVVAAVVLLVIMSLAYYAGGYVSGRMSRFDGGKQGLGAWLVGLLVSLVTVAIGAVAGSEYDIFERVNLPTLPLTSDELGLGGLLAALAILVGTLLFAMAGGKVGTRYHAKVDRAVGV
jgi:heme/copper-type cytochrome/quinol oxidase subunit 1